MGSNSPGLPLLGKSPPESWSNPDAVYTPEHLARFLVDLLPWDGVRRVLEPSVGGGAWVDALADRLELARDLEGIPGRKGLSPSLEVVGVDVDPHCRGASLDLPGFEFRRGDVLTSDLEDFDRVIGNPPYSAIREHVERALELAPEVAFLLPLDLLAGSSNARWLAGTPLRSYWPLIERPWPKKLRGACFFWWHREAAAEEPRGFAPLSWGGV